MSEHMKYPWSIHKYGGVVDSDGRDVMANGFSTACCAGDAQDRAKETSRRIVACVNACAGIPTEHLEEVQGNFGSVFLEAREKVVLYKQQRDELLAALKLCKFDSLNMTIADMKFVSAAIAKADA